MQSNEQFKLTDLSREEKLLIWMRRGRLSYRKIADKLGVTPSSVYCMLLGETMPTRRHKQCLDMGIPKPLLPPPLDITPGPKPKTALTVAQAN